MREEIVKNVYEVLEDILKRDNAHLATHQGADYYYLEDNGFDYSQTSSYPVPLHEAITTSLEQGRLRVSEDEVILPGVLFELGEGR